MELDWAGGNVILADGVEVARAERSWFRERAEVQIGPELWQFRAEGWGSGSLLADLDGPTHYAARRSGFFTSKWALDLGHPLELTQAGLFSTRLALTRGGTQIGEVTRSGMFTSRPRLTLTEPLDTRAGCFVLWVAHVELNRQSDGGASAGATG